MGRALHVGASYLDPSLKTFTKNTRERKNLLQQAIEKMHYYAFFSLKSLKIVTLKT